MLDSVYACAYTVLIDRQHTQTKEQHIMNFITNKIRANVPAAALPTTSLISRARVNISTLEIAVNLYRVAVHAKTYRADGWVQLWTEFSDYAGDNNLSLDNIISAANG